MIVTVTPNPALDLTLSLGVLTPGQVHRVPRARERAGGKGVNVARVLHTRGLTARVVAPVGGAVGIAFTADLDAAGIAHELLEVPGETRRTLALVAAETTNVNEVGTELPADGWVRLVALATAGLSAGDVVVCSGSMPPGSSDDAVAALVRTARAAGARTVVDTGGPALLAAAAAGADVLKPNRDELLAALGRTGRSLTDVVRAARELARLGGGVVLASLGADGLLQVPPHGPVRHARLPRALHGNTTGAGDAVVAAAAAALATDPGAGSSADLLRTATAWSAAAVLAPLAGELADPAPLLADVTITTIAAPEDD